MVGCIFEKLSKEADGKTKNIKYKKKKQIETKDERGDLSRRHIVRNEIGKKIV